MLYVNYISKTMEKIKLMKNLIIYNENYDAYKNKT